VRTRGRRALTVLGIALPILLLAAYIVLSIAATITIKGDFFGALGAGDAYATRWHADLALLLVGAGIGLLLASSAFLWGRALGRAVRGALFLGLALVLAVPLAIWLRGARDQILAAREAVPFGARDPVFGQDVSFFVFDLPVLRAITLMGLVAALLMLVGHVGAAWLGGALSGDRQDRYRVAGITVRLGRFVFPLAGIVVIAGGGLLWLDRYRQVYGGDEIVAGAGRAARGILIPTWTVGAVLVMASGIALALLAVPALRWRAAAASWRTFALVVAGVWAVGTLALVIFATPWWLVLALPTAALAAVAYRRRGPTPQIADPDFPYQWQDGPEGRGLRALRRPSSWSAPVGPWAWIAPPVVMLVAMAALGPIGTALNDSIVQRGSRLQVERSSIAATLAATRAASGIDRAVIRDATYRRGGVTRQAIAQSPASVGSLRFLDLPPTISACSRLQTFNQFYSCNDADVDRYPYGGRPRTVFVMGRDIDYSRITDFQRRHLTYTHGYGLVIAPVDEIDAVGRPRWLAGYIPQRGLDPAPAHPELYFGAGDAPWAIVNTDQPVFDGRATRQVQWEGGTGIRVGTGWHRLALTKFLGGLPYIGGGRAVWNATRGQPAGPDSQLLLFRDIRARAAEMYPFLSFDSDPYYASAGGRVWVLLNAYTATDRYPYAVRFGGPSYVRPAGVLAVDAYSGETHLYRLDEREPMTSTWQRVYPSLFTPIAAMPPALRTHLRYGEDLFNFQSEALERFHVTSVDTLYTNDEAWAPTEEAYGPGVDGQRIESPARYTYAVLPGERRERFLVIRSFKPAVRGRGIGFSGWFAVDSDPDRFGRMMVLRFSQSADNPLDSLDTFTSNVARDPELSAQIGVRRDQVLRGNTIVVPVGSGLLYTQPLYLDSPGDSLPSLWQVVVSFGDGKIHAASSFAEALSAALAGGEPLPPGGGEPAGATIPELLRRAEREYAAWQTATGEGRLEEAARHLRQVGEAVRRARELSERAP
jgi:uncharacterized protein